MSNPTREAELHLAKAQYNSEVSMVSNCCGWSTSEADASLMARCGGCGEGCVVEPEMTFEDWLEERK